MEKEVKKVRANTGVFNYSGGVKITLSHGSKPFKVINQHNTGTADFFKYILNCIRGYESAAGRPYFLELYDKDFHEKVTGIAFQLSSDSEPIKFDSESGYSDDAAQVGFTTFIADNYIAGKKFQGVRILNLKKVIYADVLLRELIVIEGNNTNVAIDWVITMGNAEYSEELEEL